MPIPMLALIASICLLAPADDALNAPVPPLRLEKVFGAESWVRPVGLVARPDDADQLFVIEQGGKIKSARLSTPDSGATLFMDISERVNFGSNEEGLLSLVFHPKFAENRQFFVYYSAKDPRRSVLSRFTAVGGGDSGLDFVGDPGSEEVILTVAQPYWNHNGGTALFGPDGMLYLSFGDGGAANDPQGNGQNLGTLLAKVIRIDVDHPASGQAYAVPSDNPFVGREGARPEIWAYGLRNVWRMSFDRATGTLWAGDVGQNTWEEIDRIQKGGNYGWNLREGKHPFRQRPDERGDMIDPVVDYPRTEGISVTGGHVYRGTAMPELVGVYLYADYAYGTIWGMRVDGDAQGAPQVLHQKRGLLISSFGESRDGELYVTVFEGGERGPGGVYRIVPKRVQ
ncbi:MAG: PQQ-dependent sugar dehydrogenase [Phycisphaerales bacterium]|nr:PQQ-dependent sugar dehydrogenase [Phycisphaerales bacterium]